MAEIVQPAAELARHVSLTLRHLAEIVAEMKSGPRTSRDYSLAELAQLTSYSDRTIARYIEMGLVPRPKYAGRQTRYSREALGRLLAIARGRREEKWGTSDVADELSQITAEELEALAEARDPLRPAVPPAPIAPAPIAPAPSLSEGAERPVAPMRASSEVLAPLPPVPIGWTRVTLIPGLELMVYEGGGVLVARLAEEIATKYGVNAPG